MNAPFALQLLLRAVAGRREAEFVAGDLLEEYRYLCSEKGPKAGGRWYASQVLRSIAPLARLRLERSRAAEAMAASALVLTWVLFALDRLWSFVYSLVPYKDGLDRAPEFLAFNVLAACAIGAVLGALSHSGRKAGAIASALMISAGFSAWIAVAAAPPVYLSALLAAPPACALLAYAWRRHALKRRIL